MTHVLKGSQFYLHTPRTSANGMNHTDFAFPAEAGTHLPTTEGWKAELAFTLIHYKCTDLGCSHSLPIFVTDLYENH